MTFRLLSLTMCISTYALPSVDRYITELPSHLDWDYGMVADQPYVQASPTSYIYQIEDPNANYIYSTEYWGKKDYIPFAKPKLTLRSSDKSTFRSSLTSIAQRDRVYTTPYEFNRFLPPNVLYSGYLMKPVYFVNNALNAPIYEYPRQYAYVEQPVFIDVPIIDRIDTPKMNRTQTNLTKIIIDPVTEPRSAGSNINTGIVHKQRRILNNPYGIIYHKFYSQYN